MKHIKCSKHIQLKAMKPYISKRIINKQNSLMEQLNRIDLLGDLDIFPNLPMFYAVFVFILCGFFEAVKGFVL